MTIPINSTLLRCGVGQLSLLITLKTAQRRDRKEIERVKMREKGKRGK
jgi:hypothetical protein